MGEEMANRLGNAAMSGALSEVSDQSDQSYSTSQHKSDATDESEGEAESEVDPPTRGTGNVPSDMSELGEGIELPEVEMVEDSPNEEDAESDNQEANSVEASENVAADEESDPSDTEDERGSSDTEDNEPIGGPENGSGSESRRLASEEESRSGVDGKSYDKIAEEIAEELDR